MKLEKRSDSGPVESQEETPKGKKPVVVYIMILFIAAFLLMAWSFASHQRSNTEALGRLQSSVSAMQEVQDLQDQVISLQKELAESQKNAEALSDTNTAQKSAAETLEKQLIAMEQLYTLQQQYSAGDYAACRRTIEEFEGASDTGLLPQLSKEGVTAPAERYQQLKEAVEAKLAEAEPEGD